MKKKIFVFCESTNSCLVAKLKKLASKPTSLDIGLPMFLPNFKVMNTIDLDLDRLNMQTLIFINI